MAGPLSKKVDEIDLDGSVDSLLPMKHNVGATMQVISGLENEPIEK